MRLNADEIPATLWVPALFIFLGSIFEVGYFNTLGLEFLTTVAPGDWFFSLMVLSLPLASFGIFIILLARIGARLLVRFVSWTESDWGKHIISPFPGWAWLLIYVYLIMVLRHNLPQSNPIIEAAIFILVLGQTALFWSSLEDGYEWRLSELVWLGLGWVVVVFSLGQYYGVAGGRVCTLSFKEGRQLTAVYMRSVSGGHLIRLANSSYFLDKSTVDEIRCAWSDNSWDARMKLAFPGLKK